MQDQHHWGEFAEDETENVPFDKYVPTSLKKPKLDEVSADIQPIQQVNCVRLKSSLITQTIEVMKQTEVLQSLIDTYSNKNGTSNYLLNPCQMIPEVDFPPENAADLVGEQKFQKPIWFIPTVDTSYSRGDPQSYTQISNNISRQVIRKLLCGLLRLAGFTDCSETAIVLFTDAAEEFLRSFVAEYRSCYDNNKSLEKSTSLKLLPLEQAYTAVTGTSLMQVHNYFKHKVITRNRTEIAEFTSVLQEYDKLMKESQSSMQKQQDFGGTDFLNILEMQPNESGAGTSNSMGQMVGDMPQELAGNMGGANCQQQPMLNNNMLYSFLDNQMFNNSNMASTSAGYQGSFE